MSSSRIPYATGSFSTEQARDVRARAWAFVFECWHTKKGGHHDLTKNVTKECTTRPEKKGTDDADVHRNGL
jgi:hypothetical protein